MFHYAWLPESFVGPKLFQPQSPSKDQTSLGMLGILGHESRYHRQTAGHLSSGCFYWRVVHEPQFIVNISHPRGLHAVAHSSGAFLSASTSPPKTSSKSLLKLQLHFTCVAAPQGICIGKLQPHLPSQQHLSFSSQCAESHLNPSTACRNPEPRA